MTTQSFMPVWQNSRRKGIITRVPNYLFLLLTIYPLTLQAQYWAKETLATDIIGAWTRVADFDNDGDPDILVQDNFNIYWYENLRPGWTPHLIDNTFYGSATAFVDVLDMDSDGDMDIFKVPTPGDGGDPITWNENKSNGAEWVKHDIVNSVATVGWMQFSWGDLDKDGDLDLVIPEVSFTTTTPYDGLYWLENLGAEGWTKHSLMPLRNYYSSVADMDGDGDLDILSSADKLYWLENQLPETTWPQHLIRSKSGPFTHFIGTAADLTNDGKPDVISIRPSPTNGGLAMYPNPGWSFTSLKASGSGDLHLGAIADLDGDGDLDVTYGGAGGFSQALGWMENQDNGAKWVAHDILPAEPFQMIPSGVADIDGDGDLDIVSLTFDIQTKKGSAFWVANPSMVTHVKDRQGSADLLRFRTWPNPFSTQVNIEYQLPEAGMVRLAVLDQFGREISILAKARQRAGAHTFSWEGNLDNDIAAPPGVYFLCLKTAKGTVNKMVVWSGQGKG